MRRRAVTFIENFLLISLLEELMEYAMCIVHRGGPWGPGGRRGTIYLHGQLSVEHPFVEGHGEAGVDKLPVVHGHCNKTT